MVTKGNKSVFGLYPSRIAAEQAVEQLRLEGFRNSDISVLFGTPSATKSFAHENSTKAPEGAAAGAVSGATVGGIIGWLAGVGTLAIPGVGPFIAAGPIMAALAGVGVGGTIGTITGTLVGLGVPEYEAKRFDEVLRGDKEKVLLSVHVDDSQWLKKARDVLERSGAQDISSKKEEEVSDDNDDVDAPRGTSGVLY